MSLLDALNLPAGFGYLLLVLGLVFTLAPWFHGHDFGVIKIPDFGPTARRTLMVAGPLALVAAVFLHLPRDALTNTDDGVAVPQFAPDTAAAEQSRGNPQATAPGQRQADARTLAEWQGSGCYYPVSFIVDVEGRTRAVFDFDRQAEVPAASVMVAAEPALKTGATAYARIQNREAWLPVAIDVVGTPKIKVTSDPKVACAAEFGKSTQWVERDALITLRPMERQL